MASSPRPQSISANSEESPDYTPARTGEGSAGGSPSSEGKGKEIATAQGQDMGCIPASLEKEPVRECIEDHLKKVGWRDLPAPYGIGQVPGLEDLGGLKGRDSLFLDSLSRPKVGAHQAGDGSPEPIGQAPQGLGDDAASEEETQKRWKSSWDRVHSLVGEVDQIYRAAAEERRARNDTEKSS